MDENYEINYDNKVAEYNGLDYYINATRKIPLLSDEEEKELFIEMKNGSKTARQKLIESNLRLVINRAKNYKQKHVDASFEELIAEGNYALVKAVDHFDIDKSVKFSSYAVKCIDARLVQTRSFDEYSTYIPVNDLHLMRRMKRIIRDYYAKNGTNPSDEYLMKELKISRFKLESYKHVPNTIISLNDQASDEKDLEIVNVVPDPNLPSMDERLIEEELKEILNSLLDNLLTPKQAFVLRKYYSSTNGEKVTLESIGKSQDVTRERIRQVKEKAIRKLKNSQYYNLLKNFINDTDENTIGKNNIRPKRRKSDRNKNSNFYILNNGEDNKILLELSCELFSFLYPELFEKIINDDISFDEYEEALENESNLLNFLRSIICEECLLNKQVGKVEKKDLEKIKNKVLKIKAFNDNSELTELQKIILRFKLGYFNESSYRNSAICSILRMTKKSFFEVYEPAILKLYSDYVNNKNKQKAKGKWV